MEALSQLVKRRVYDQEHILVGTLVEVVVLLTNGGTKPSRAGGPVRVTPLVQALLIQRPEGGRLRVSPTQVERVEPHALFLTCAARALPLAEAHPDELALVEEVLDHQMMDLTNLRVRRVNEVWFDAQWRLIGVTCSSLSCLSRVLPARLAARLSRRAARSLLSWNQVALFPPADPERAGSLPLRLPMGTLPLASWSPGALAALVQQLHPYAGSQVLSALPPTVAAKILGRLPSLQRPRVLRHLSVPQAAALVQRLSPAVAVAVLGTLPEGFAQVLLESLNPEATALLQGALAYPADAAGGLMTSTCLRISQEWTAAEAVAWLRTVRDTPGLRTYLYCLAGASGTVFEERLVGVVSLWDLLTADPGSRLQDLMHTALVSVSPETDLVTVAATLEASGLLALPVLDAAGELFGVVTLEAVLSWLLSPRQRAWHWLSKRQPERLQERRLPRKEKGVVRG
jgi:magnesium transporter